VIPWKALPEQHIKKKKMSDNKCSGITIEWNLEGNNFFAGSLMMHTSGEELLAVERSAENK
jgi:hypothetical protein